MTMTKRCSLLSLALAGLLGLAACGNDDGGAGAGPANNGTETTTSGANAPEGDTIVETVSGARGEILASAVDSTSGGSARMALSMEMGALFDISAEGLIDFDSGDTAMTMDMSAIAALAGPDEEIDPDDLIIEMRIVDQIVYMKLPGFMASVFGAEPGSWIAIDPEAIAGATDLESLTELSDQSDPSQILSFLRSASDDVEQTGREEVRGEPTDRYEGTLDFARAFDSLPEDVQGEFDDRFGAEIDGQLADLVDQLGLDEMPYTVWIDDEGRMRKLEITFDLGEVMSAAGEEMPPGLGSEFTMVFELYDYGVEVDIEPPPVEEITELDPSTLLGGALGD